MGKTELGIEGEGHTPTKVVRLRPEGRPSFGAIALPEDEMMTASFWADKRPAGIPNDIDLTQYSSIIDVFDQACVKHAKLAAFSNMGVTLTYADLDRLSAAFASYLQQHTDLEPGDRIAVQMPNVLQFPIAVFGAIRSA